MLNILIEKCADWLLPIIGGCLVWYGLHYFVLTPRIINKEYEHFYVQDKSLPETVNNCLHERLGDQILRTGLLETALYTATIRRVATPYQEALTEAYASLDETCGVSYARRKAQEQKRRAVETENRINRIADEFKFWRKLLTGE